MKKIFLGALVALLSTTSVFAQHYQESRYYNQESGKLDYGNQRSSRSYGDNQSYVGFRVGATFSTVHSESSELNAKSTKTGLNVGIVTGFPLIQYVPLYFETGLSYKEKGGKAKNSSSSSTSNSKFTYTLGYLELPFVFKYKYNFDEHFAIQPYLGGYFALGVAGKIKDYDVYEKYNSFGSDDNQFKRFDGGLKFGVGLSYDLFYVEADYDLGLSNIGHDLQGTKKQAFNDTRNRCFSLNVGVNF